MAPHHSSGKPGEAGPCGTGELSEPAKTRLATTALDVAVLPAGVVTRTRTECSPEASVVPVREWSNGRHPSPFASHSSPVQMTSGALCALLGAMGATAAIVATVAVVNGLRVDFSTPGVRP